MKELFSVFVWRFMALSKVTRCSVLCHLGQSPAGKWLNKDKNIGALGFLDSEQKRILFWLWFDVSEAKSCSNFFCQVRRVRRG